MEKRRFPETLQKMEWGRRPGWNLGGKGEKGRRYWVTVKYTENGTSLVVQWLRLHAPNARGPGSIPGWQSRPHMLQLKFLSAKTKAQHSQTNKHLKRKKEIHGRDWRDGECRKPGVREVIQVISSI